MCVFIKVGIKIQTLKILSELHKTIMNKKYSVYTVVARLFSSSK